MSDTIVVGTDGSASVKKALDEACHLAKALGAEIHVVSAYAPFAGRASSVGPRVAPEPESSGIDEAPIGPRP